MGKMANLIAIETSYGAYVIAFSYGSKSYYTPPIPRVSSSSYYIERSNLSSKASRDLHFSVLCVMDPKNTKGKNRS